MSNNELNTLRPFHCENEMPSLASKITAVFADRGVSRLLTRRKLGPALVASCVSSLLCWNAVSLSYGIDSDDAAKESLANVATHRTESSPSDKPLAINDLPAALPAESHPEDGETDKPAPGAINVFDKQMQSDNPVVAPKPIQKISNAAEVYCPQSEIFELSTRHLPKRFCAINEDAPGFEVTHWTGCQWVCSDIDSALGIQNRLVSDSKNSEATSSIHIDDKATILYIHGNFMERNNTLQRARFIDAQLKKRAKRDYRLLVLSWPSQKAGRPVRDVYDNAESSEDQALYVAWLLRKLKYHTRVSILGFSFGARAATGGLHLDAGGHISGLVHTANPEGALEAGKRYLPYRLGLIAPAIDKRWIESCGLHNRALDQVSHFVNMYNSKDPALRRFRFIDRFSQPIAGGYAGFDLLTDSRPTFQLDRGGVEHSIPLKVQQFDCGNAIGATHDEQRYLGQCPYFSRMMDVLLWNTDPSDELIQSLVSGQ